MEAHCVCVCVRACLPEVGLGIKLPSPFLAAVTADIPATHGEHPRSPVLLSARAIVFARVTAQAVVSAAQEAEVGCTLVLTRSRAAWS